jgi:hypothetical protein
LCQLAIRDCDRTRQIGLNGPDPGGPVEVASHHLDAAGRPEHVAESQELSAQMLCL